MKCYDVEENGCDVWQQSMRYHTIIITVIIQHALLLSVDYVDVVLVWSNEKTLDSIHTCTPLKAHTAKGLTTIFVCNRIWLT